MASARALLDFDIVEVALELLLGSDGFGTGLGFGVHGGLHGFEGSLAVSSSVVDLLFLLGESSLEVLLVLGHLDGEAENLGFFNFDGTFGFFESSLEFVSLLLEGSLGLLEFVDGLATFAELVGEIGNLLLEVLVLSLDGFKAVEGFFVSVLGLEELGGEGSGFLLAGLEFDLEFLLLLLVLGEDLVEVSLLLVEGSGGGVSSLEVDLEIFDFSELSDLGLLERSALGLGGLDEFLHLLELGGKLLLGLLELFSSLDGIGFVLGPPGSDLGVGLGKSTLELGLGFLLP